MAWASAKMQDLLKPSDDTTIPELDALLSAYGPHDASERERRLQRMLSSSLKEVEKYLSLSCLEDGELRHVASSIRKRRRCLDDRVQSCECELQGKKKPAKGYSISNEEPEFCSKEIASGFLKETLDDIEIDPFVKQMQCFLQKYEDIHEK